MKKVLKLLIVALLSMGLVACSGESDAINLSLSEILDKLYEGIPADEMPMMTEYVEANSDNEYWYLGTKGLEFEEALAVEPMIGSIAHSVVLVKVGDESKVEAVENEIKENIDTRKWVCVGIEKDQLIIEHRGDIILVVIDDLGIGNTIKENFENIK